MQNDLTVCVGGGQIVYIKTVILQSEKIHDKSRVCWKKRSLGPEEGDSFP